MNSVPHAFDGTYSNRGEAADENMRRVQKETATALKALGYDVYHFNMGEYTRINLINEGAAACPGHTVTNDYREEETAIHSDYYNINTGTQRNEGTHPNYRGYNKMADGVYEVVLYVLKDGAKPALMIDIQ
jgi:lysophospholipase L1-like esterase